MISLVRIWIGDLLIFNPKDAIKLKAENNLLICSNISNNIEIVKPETGKIAVIDHFHLIYQFPFYPSIHTAS